MALALGGSFVAIAFSGDIPHLVRVIKEAIHHRGFALVDILQPCVTFNYLNTFSWYKKRVYRLDEAGHDIADRFAAFKKAQEWGDRIPIGVFYKKEKPAFEEQFPTLRDEPLVKQRIEPEQFEKLVEEFL